MTALEAFGLIAGVASLVSIPLAVYYAKRHAAREKLLVFRADIALFPLASTRSLAAYRLSVMYEGSNGKRDEIKDAFIHFLSFANFGREPVRKSDIAPHNPLRIEVQGAPVLDIALEASRRPVCAIAVGGFSTDGEETTSAAVDLDFLDYLDGAVARILTTGRPSEITLAGDIIGMPGGIRDANKPSNNRALTWLGTTLVILAFVSALALTPFVFNWVTGSWANVWLLALPFIAVILPLVIVVVVATTIWPSQDFKFPRELLPRLRGMPAPVYYRHMQVAGPLSFETGYDFALDPDDPQFARTDHARSAEGNRSASEHAGDPPA